MTEPTRYTELAEVLNGGEIFKIIQGACNASDLTCTLTVTNDIFNMRDGCFDCRTVEDNKLWLKHFRRCWSERKDTINFHQLTHLQSIDVLMCGIIESQEKSNTASEALTRD